jgi:hypothetical protein
MARQRQTCCQESDGQVPRPVGNRFKHAVLI